MQSNDTSHDTSARLQRKPIAFEVFIFSCSPLPLVGVESADIESAYNFCVSCFNKKNGLGLASSVQKKWVFKVGSKIVGNTLKDDHYREDAPLFIFQTYPVILHELFEFINTRPIRVAIWEHIFWSISLTRIRTDLSYILQLKLAQGFSYFSRKKRSYPVRGSLS